MLCCVVLCCAVLCCVVLCCIVSSCRVVLHCIALHCIALYCIVLCCIALYCFSCCVLCVFSCLAFLCARLCYVVFWRCHALRCFALHGCVVFSDLVLRRPVLCWTGLCLVALSCVCFTRHASSLMLPSYVLYHPSTMNPTVLLMCFPVWYIDLQTVSVVTTLIWMSDVHNITLQTLSLPQGL